MSFSGRTCDLDAANELYAARFGRPPNTTAPTPTSIKALEGIAHVMSRHLARVKRKSSDQGRTRTVFSAANS